jgi:hypothetical protein
VPKIFNREVPPIVLVLGVGLLGYLVYDMAFSSAPSSGATTKVRRRGVTTKAQDSQYLKEDYEAKFAVYKQPASNVFRPLVVGETVASAGQKELAKGEIPSALTGGEGSWKYTGFAAVNGERQGLLENGSTQESVFLTIGQQWRLLTVRAIGEEQMVVAGPTGEEITIPIGTTTAEQSSNTGVVPGGGVPPVNPGAPLTGPIAQQPGTNPEDLRVQPSNDQGQDARRSWRRRRGN